MCIRDRDYKAIVRWMEQGMPYGSPDDPTLQKISVFPDSRIVDPGGKQQLAVTAYYSDGSVRDITGIATYESNQKEMGEVDQNGLVTMSVGETGDMAVMIRYQEQVSVFQATIPLGIPIESFPIAKNIIDEKVFSIPQIILVGRRGAPGIKDEPQHAKIGPKTLSLLKSLIFEWFL